MKSPPKRDSGALLKNRWLITLALGYLSHWSTQTLGTGKMNHGAASLFAILHKREMKCKLKYYYFKTIFRNIKTPILRVTSLGLPEFERHSRYVMGDHWWLLCLAVTQSDLCFRLISHSDDGVENSYPGEKTGTEKPV